MKQAQVEVKQLPEGNISSTSTSASLRTHGALALDPSADPSAARLRSGDPSKLESLTRGTSVYRLRSEPAPAARWELATLSGRLVELSSDGDAAGLTLAVSLVLDAQHRDEPAAWLTTKKRSFFPPDVAASGVDLEALVVARLEQAEQVPRAAEHLLRSGAFGLLVLDLEFPAHISVPMQMRLVGLAQKHDATVLCVTRKNSEAPSLGSLVSLRAEARRERIDEPSQRLESNCGDGGFRGNSFDSSKFSCTAHVIKDKRRRPGWTHREVYRGPHGLR